MNVHLPQMLFALGLLAFVGVRIHFQRGAAAVPVAASRSDRLDRWLVVLVVLGQVVVPAAYILTPWLDFASFQPWRIAVPIGLPLWVAGLWLFWRSHRDLGKNWSGTLDIRSSHALVTSGVYRSIRHPMYASFLVLALAQIVLLPNRVAGPAALVAVAILCLVRVPREEAMMREFFGDAYSRYVRETGAVVPRIGSNREA